MTTNRGAALGMLGPIGALGMLGALGPLGGLCLLGALGALAFPAAAAAQQAYAVPQSPAFTYLDVSPTKVERPTTAREFGVGLLNGIDAEGRFRQGFAVEAAPWPWIPGVSIPASQYGHTLKYMLANLSVSAASARASGDSASTDLAFGLRTTILDRSDPMADRAFRDSLRAVLVACNMASAEATDASVRACAAGGNAELRRRWLDRHWNGSSLSVALASGVRLRESVLSAGAWSGISGWAALALPLTADGQLMVQTRLDHRAGIDTVDAATAWRTGARAVFGSAVVNAFLELEHNSDPVGGAAPTTGWTGGVEFRAADELWISTGFGKGYDALRADHVVLLANIRWRVNGGPRLGTGH